MHINDLLNAMEAAGLTQDQRNDEQLREASKKLMALGRAEGAAACKEMCSTLLDFVDLAEANPEGYDKAEAAKKLQRVYELARDVHSLLHAKVVENYLGNRVDAEKPACGACNGSGRLPRDPDIGTDQECGFCKGSGDE